MGTCYNSCVLRCLMRVAIDGPSHPVADSIWAEVRPDSEEPKPYVKPVLEFLASVKTQAL